MEHPADNRSQRVQECKSQGVRQLGRDGWMEGWRGGGMEDGRKAEDDLAGESPPKGVGVITKHAWRNDSKGRRETG